MAVSCDPNDLASAAKCFLQGYDRVVLQAMRISLWCAFLNSDSVDCSPESLLEAAKCYLAEMSPEQLDAVETYLACQIATSGGGGGGGTIQVFQDHTGSPPGDPTKPALSFPTGGGTISQWDVDSQSWL